ncbi:hypothetical protein BD410DRAFT_789934 [Rickenella mellea]|uniref:Uncharacterized protein n=1 Tax=Rickenella mellea TaxID=50990 RepID=A0A4Y7Q198_9AGAM|nr:hypothetical protein BD410DRAFT_789934 [Rickenella mellea]
MSRDKELPSSPNEPCEESLLYNPEDDSKANSTPDNPGDSMMFKPKPTYRSANIASAIVTTFRVGLFPTVAIAYISFCFVVHYQNVYVSATTPTQLARVKSGMTSLAIIVIAIALIPLKSLLSSLQSEEFFRTLKERPQGVPVALINNAGSSTRGTLDALKSVKYRAGSSLLVWSLLSSILVIAISTLAPAALSIESADVEGETMAFLVGGVTYETVQETSGNSLLGESSAMTRIIQEASGIAWTEYILGINYSFRSATMSTVVPFPLDLNATTPARWISDVVFVNPSCNWLSPPSMQNATTSTSLGLQLSGVLPGTDVKVIFAQNPDGTPRDAFSGNSFGILKPGPQSFYVMNATTGSDVTDGSSVFQLVQCTNCTRYSGSMRTTVDLTGIPTLTLTLNGTTFAVSYLHCTPHASFHTREVTNNGGLLSVGQSDITPRSGNLLPTQTTLFFSQVFQALGELNTPTAPPVISALGSSLMTSFLFGVDVVKNLTSHNGVDPITLQPSSLATITADYCLLLRSFAKPGLNGALASSFVPGRATRKVAHITSSLPYVIVSTIAMLLLVVFGILCHFRSEVAPFTFVDIAYAVAGSGISKDSVVGDPSKPEQRILAIRERDAAGDAFEKGPILKISENM